VSGRWIIWVLALAAACVGEAVAQSQNGALRGTILDADFSVPVSGVTVVVEGTGVGASTGQDGSFFINDLPPGQYTILASKEGFVRERRSSIIVTAGSVKDMDMDMTAEVVELDEFVVAEEEIVDTTATTGAITLRTELKSFTEVLGAQFIASTGASNAANLLAKTTGVNVADGKFVVVRGLADRYNSVTLNGLRIPSSDPDRRAVALDLFPSSVIKDVRTSKTYLPDQPGESTGASINVVTKTVPQENFEKIKIGNGFNTQVTGNNKFLSYTGGGTGTFGNYQDRALPSFIQNAALPDLFSGGGPADTPAERALRQTISNTLSKEMGTKDKTAPMDFSLEASLGRRFDFMGAPAGLTVAFDYSKKYNYSDVDALGRYSFVSNLASPNLGQVENTTRLVLPASRLPAGTTQADWGMRVGQETMRAGMLVSLGIELDTDSELNLTYFFNRVAEDRATYQLGYDPQDPAIAKYRESISYTERQVRTWQLAGRHAVDGIGADMKVSWAVSYNQSYQYEPDLRLMASDFDTASGQYSVPANLTVPPFQRYWRNLNDESYNARMDIESDLFGDSLPDEMKAKIKFGGLLDYSDRAYRADSFSYNAGFLDNSGYPNFLKPQTIPSQTWGDVFLYGNQNLTTPGLSLSNATYIFRQNEAEVYRASQMISAGYLMFDVDVTPNLNVSFGARMETTDLKVQASDIWIYPEESVRLALLTAEQRRDNLYTDALTAAYGGIATDAQKALLAPRSRANIAEVSMLPALAVNWDLTEHQRVRTAITRTIARPSFKEIAPVAFSVVETGDFFIGNPDLLMSSITNFDVRWEYFPSPGSLIGVSAFAKTIDKPIEYSQVGQFTQYINVDSATVYGFELEYQRDFGFLADELKPLNMGLNYSFIQSQADRGNVGGPAIFGQTRRLQGQPDYIFNLNLTYDHQDSGWFFGTFLNVTGQQLSAVSSVFNQPDIFQEPYTTLDLGISKRLFKGCKLSFRAANVTNQTIRRVYNNAQKPVFSERSPGINYSLSLAFDW
jgi:outer membrane receptor protein involved in Fe transport